MMIELHRKPSDDFFPESEQDNRISIERDDIRQVHVGRGGVTVVTTPTGRIPVEEKYEEVKKIKNQ